LHKCERRSLLKHIDATLGTEAIVEYIVATMGTEAIVEYIVATMGTEAIVECIVATMGTEAIVEYIVATMGTVEARKYLPLLYRNKATRMTRSYCCNSVFQHLHTATMSKCDISSRFL
jgi:hypothetical protein